MTYLFYVIAAVAVIVIILLARKLNITENEASLLKLIATIIDEVNKKLPSWKFSGELSIVCQYAIIAKSIVQRTHDINDIVELKKFIMIEVEDICKLNSIVVDADFVNLLSAIVDALIAQEVK